ncbi:glycosyltransferase [Pseudodesulfovibrio sp.]|uniref:glycosyltransferase n=1 Tax=unclassified Pseudodesulfovibrio TaxID=2661612 RepID=UPI003B00D4E4
MIRSSIPVFCYHNVSEIDGHTPELFAEHLDAMADAGWRTISAMDLLDVVRGKRKAPRKSLVLTFDDGHLSNWLTVVPELARRDMTGTFFALTDFTVPGRPRTHDSAPAMRTMPEAFKHALQGDDFSQFINESEIRAMLDKGMEVFAHGCRHQGVFRTLSPQATMSERHARWPAWSIYPGYDPAWPTFNDGSAYVYDGFKPVFDRPGTQPRFVIRTPEERLRFCREDFARSMRRIRELNGLTEQLFCWPWGQYREDAQAELRAAGFAGAFTLERWVNAKGTDPFRLNRIGVGRPKTGKWIQARLRMYGSDPAARVFFKLQRLKPEVKRVLYATDSQRLSGGSRQLLNNIKAMRDMGAEVYAVLQPDSPLVAPATELGAEVATFDAFSSYLRAGSFLARMVREHRIDVVHTFHNRAYKMGVIARLMGARFDLFINRGVISRPNDIFFLWTKAARGVICNSKCCADVLAHYRVAKKRLNVVYNAYDGPDFGDPAFRKKRGTRFAYVGNGAEIKGLDVFLRAAARFCEANARDVEFLVIGLRLDEVKKFEDIITPELRQRLTFAGELPHAEVIDSLRFSDVLCMTSRKESLPNGLIEALNLGLPGLCTSVGGVPELVHEGVNGLLCESEDIECLAAKMRTLADDPVARHRMGLSGRAVIRSQFSPEAKGRRLMRVYMGEQVDEPLDVQAVKNFSPPPDSDHD